MPNIRKCSDKKKVAARWIKPYSGPDVPPQAIVWRPLPHGKLLLKQMQLEKKFVLCYGTRQLFKVKKTNCPIGNAHAL